MEGIIMMRYKKHGETISVDLGNGYSVWGMALWNYENHYYNMTLYLQDNAIQQLRLVEEAENIHFKANRKILYAEMTRYIQKLIEDGFFVAYIEKYQYEMSCFDKGNEFFEQG